MAQVTSESHAGEYVYHQHPNLRKRTQLQFTARDQLEPCDVLFLALPHGEAQKHIDKYLGLAPKIVDLSADFRLKDAALYKKWYGEDHKAPQYLGQFVYGLPELQREAMKTATLHQRRGLQCDRVESGAAAAGESEPDRSRQADRRRYQNGIVRRRRERECRLASSREEPFGARLCSDRTSAHRRGDSRAGPEAMCISA